MNKKNDIIERHISFDVSLREKEGDVESRTIAGRAILFDQESVPLWEDEDEVAVEKISPNAITREFLDQCDIKMTMFHDRQLILARSFNGEGTLKYDVDSDGVTFEFEAPHTVDGDKCIELVRRGDLKGCSFAFRTKYFDEQYVGREVEKVNGKAKTTFTVNVVTDVLDFTIAADPFYQATEVDVRELREHMRELRKDSMEDQELKERELEEREMKERKMRKRDAVRRLRDLAD